MKLTYKIAWSASQDAANRNMRKHGRKVWTEDDYNVAMDTLDKLATVHRMGYPTPDWAEQMMAENTPGLRVAPISPERVAELEAMSRKG